MKYKYIVSYDGETIDQLARYKSVNDLVEWYNDNAVDNSNRWVESYWWTAKLLLKQKQKYKPITGEELFEEFL